MSTNALAFFKRGQQRDIRMFDEWLRMIFSLDRLNDIAPWITPNHITALRLVVLVPTLHLLLVFNPAHTVHLVLLGVAVLCCVIDAYTDILDGIWYRLFGAGQFFFNSMAADQYLRPVLKSPEVFGAFFDQFSDKLSNWSRMAALLHLTRAAYELTVDIYGVPLLWVCLAVAACCDGYNLTVRIRDYGKPAVKAKRASSFFGKAKTWLQGLGITFMLMSFAVSQAVVHGTPFAQLTVAALVLTATGLAALLVPKRLQEEQWVVHVWYLAGMIALLAVTFTTLFGGELGRRIISGIGECFLYASVIGALLSTGTQIIGQSSR